MITYLYIIGTHPHAGLRVQATGRVIDIADKGPRLLEVETENGIRCYAARHQLRIRAAVQAKVGDTS